MTRALTLAWLLPAALGCGKYGQPLRAGEIEPAKAAPRLEVPLPAPGTEPATGEPAPQPEVEQEPPPEGAP